MLVLISKEAKKMNKQPPFEHLEGQKTLKTHGDI